jgi:hypothetical protein
MYIIQLSVLKYKARIGIPDNYAIKHLFGSEVRGYNVIRLWHMTDYEE